MVTIFKYHICIASEGKFKPTGQVYTTQTEMMEKHKSCYYFVEFVGKPIPDKVDVFGYRCGWRWDDQINIIF